MNISRLTQPPDKPNVFPLSAFWSEVGWRRMNLQSCAISFANSFAFATHGMRPDGCAHKLPRLNQSLDLPSGGESIAVASGTMLAYSEYFICGTTLDDFAKLLHFKVECLVRRCIWSQWWTVSCVTFCHNRPNIYSPSGPALCDKPKTLTWHSASQYTLAKVVVNKCVKASTALSSLTRLTGTVTGGNASCQAGFLYGFMPGLTSYCTYTTCSYVLHHILMHSRSTAPG